MIVQVVKVQQGNGTVCQYPTIAVVLDKVWIRTTARGSLRGGTSRVLCMGGCQWQRHDQAHSMLLSRSPPAMSWCAISASGTPKRMPKHVHTLVATCSGT